ncbi:MAG: Hsp20/alpha crystallin family protein [Methyloceanibacter sp.]
MAEPVTKLPIRKESPEAGAGEWRPMTGLRREIDRLFEDFGWGPGRWPSGRSLFDIEPFGRGELAFGKVPAVDVAEKEKEYEITAELPGLDESNVEVKFADGMLTIKGEKREEKEEKKKDYYLSERRFGSFQRSFQVPDGVDADKIAASFKNGVLTVVLPKSPEAQKREKTIAVKKA